MLNVAPVAQDDQYAILYSSAPLLSVAAPGVLANDYDADGDTLTPSVVNPPLHGSVGLNADGSFLYTPNPGFRGTDLFTYEVSDGTLGCTQPAGVRVSVEPPSLLKDINLGDGGGTPQGLTSVGATLYFSAYDGTRGRELWKSDGTPEGTVVVKDIWPGPGSSNPQNLTNVGGTLFFTADDGTDGTEIWKSDGTTAGTVIVQDVRTGSSSSTPQFLTDVNGTLYFSANDGVNGQEFWKSDGTAAGTALVKDVLPGSNGATPQYLTNVNGNVYFSAYGGVGGTELWKSDGTAAGTALLKDIWPGINPSTPQYLTNVDGTLYFTANDGVSGTELWKSDGTADGTVLVKDIWPGSHGSGDNTSGPQYLTNVNGSLYFSANDGPDGSELWKSDGTADGTALVKDIYPGGFPSGPQYLINVNGTLYFFCNDGWLGVWKSDGTAAGTVLVKHTGSNSPIGMASVNGSVYFSAADQTHGSELWKSDGTPGGSVMVKDIRPGVSGSQLQYLTAVGSALFFSADDWTHGFELWKSDGTATGTVLVKDLSQGNGGSISQKPAVLNGTVFFSADDGTHGPELWKTDGTRVGTVLVKDICSGSIGSGPRYLTTFNDTLFFSATDDTHGVELWKSDGTSAGTVLVNDIDPGAGWGDPSYLTVLNGTLYFIASGGGLWKSDGTSAGTVLVKDIDILLGVRLTSVNGTMYFDAYDGTHGTELWKSDGTSAGTVLVKDIWPGSPSSVPLNLTNFNGALYFNAADGVTGIGFWTSDGTAAGTVLVKPGSSLSSPQYLTDVNGTLYFSASGGGGAELWKTDGTAAGTVLVKDIRPGATGSGPQYLTNVNGTLCFSANDGVTGTELWKSDGTGAGTVLVKDIRPGGTGSGPRYLTNVNGTLYFAADDGASGIEIWKTGGTAAGTVLVADLAPGPLSSAPANLTVLERRLLFSADDGSAGSELWILDLTPLTADIVDVAPDPRDNPVSQIAIDFSEPVTGFDLADLTLTRGSGPNLLTSSQTLTTTDNSHWTLGNLTGLTAGVGTYLLTLTAAGSGIQDTAGNLLVIDAAETWTVSTTAFNGTSGDDTLAFSTDGTWHHVTVTLAGQPTQNFTYLASIPVTLTFNGNGGNDKITIDGGPQNETVVTHASSVTFNGPVNTYTVVASAINDIRVTAGLGTGQTATMYDAPGTNDTFTSQPTFADMTSSGYYCRATGFGPVNAYASGDPGDTAKFYDSPGADTFTAQPGLSSMSGPGYATNVAHGFKKQYGYASFVYGQLGQGDRANIYDSVGNDTWIGYGPLNYGEITGPGGLYYVRAQGFDQQYGYETADAVGSGAQNVARFYDTPGDDVFNAKGDYSYLAGVNTQTWWFASGFQRVYAQKTSGGGFDRAFFSHTTGNYKMTYNVRSYQGYAADIQPNGSNTFYNIASDFNEYEGVASIPGNTDEAFFRTTGGGDTITFTPVGGGTNFAIADLSGTTLPPASKPIHLYAYGFKTNTILRDSDVGTGLPDTAVDTATLTGTSGNDTFVGTPNDSTLVLSTGPSIRLTYWPQPTQRGIDKITVLGNGGNDTATLTGSATGTNQFVGNLTDAVLSDGTLDLTTPGHLGDLLAERVPFGYYFKMSGFDSLLDHVTVNAAGTDNKKHVVNPVDYALTFNGTWLDV